MTFHARHKILILRRTLAKARFLHSPLLIKLFPRLGHRRLIRTARHSHPPRQNPQEIHRIERLTPTIDLCHTTGFPLRRSDTPGIERNPVNLVFKGSRYRPVHFRTDPAVAIRPVGEGTEFPDFGAGAFEGWVADWQAAWIIDADVAAEEIEEAGEFVGEFAGKGCGAEGAIEDEDFGGTANGKLHIVELGNFSFDFLFNPIVGGVVFAVCVPAAEKGFWVRFKCISWVRKR